MLAIPENTMKIPPATRGKSPIRSTRWATFLIGGSETNRGHTTHSLARRIGIEAIPAATCRPWVTRYRPAGRAGTGSQLSGCWCRWEYSPVTKQIENKMPSDAPSHAARRSSRRALWYACWWRGSSGSVVSSRTRRSIASRAGISPHGRVLQPDDPPTLEPPHLGDSEAGRASDGVDRVTPHDGPREPAARVLLALEPGAAGAPTAAGRLDLGDDRAAGAQQRCAAFEKAARVAADAEVAVQEEDCLPPPCAGEGIEHRPLEDGAPLAPGEGGSGGRRIDAEGRDPLPGERVEHPTGPASHIEDGPADACKQNALLRRGRTVPPRRFQGKGATFLVTHDQQGPGHETIASAGLVHRRHAVAVRRCGCASATAARCANVSMSRCSCTTETARPRARSRLSCVSPVWGVLISTPPNTRRGSVPGSPITHQPPSDAGPNTAVRSCRDAGGETSRESRSSSSDGVTCGVSIPIWIPQPPVDGAVAAHAFASRGPSPRPAWGMTSKPSGIHGPGRPWRAMIFRSARHAATAASVSASAASATSAASCGESGGHSRVLTWPATGDLAITRTCTALTAGLDPCPTQRGQSPGPYRSPSSAPSGARPPRRPLARAIRRRGRAAPSRAATQTVGR